MLPTAANEAVDRFMSDAGSQIRGNTAGDALLIRTILVKLVAFEVRDDLQSLTVQRSESVRLRSLHSCISSGWLS